MRIYFFAIFGLGFGLVPNRAYAADVSLNIFALVSASVSILVVLGLAILIASHLRHKLLETRARLERANDSVRSLRNRVNGLERLIERFNQGFFSFDFDGRLIPGKRSRAVVARFGKLSRDSTVFDLLSVKGDERRHLAKFLKHLQSGRITLEEFSAVAPRRLSLEGRVIDVEYAFDPLPAALQPSHLVAVFIDKTEQIAALEESRESQAYVDLILTIVRDRESFKLFLADARRLLQRLKGLAEEPLRADTFHSLAMALHTLKGSAGLANFDRVARLAHQLESKLKETQKSFERKDPATDFAAVMGDVLLELALIEAEIEKVYDDFRDLLGFVPVFSSLQGESGPLLNLDDYVLRQRAAIEDMASRVGKRVRLDLSITGIEGASERVGDLLSSLVHIFRNAIDHGIEPPEERLSLGKPKTATISITVRELILEQRPFIELSISDDGRGIDPARVREIARQKLDSSTLGPRDLTAMSDHDVLRLIFEDGFSSRDTADLTSGRGVGLGACRSEVEKLGGTIEVQTETGQGTRFILRWPRVRNDASPAQAA